MLEGLFPDILITTLSSSGVVVLWFFSPFKCTLAKMLFKVEECYDPSNFDDLLGLKFKKLGFLSGCHFCVFFWCSCTFSLFVTNNPYEYLLCIFSCNYLHFILNNYIYGR